MPNHKAGRSPADWDQDTWDGVKSLIDHAATLDPPDRVRFAASMDGVGFALGAAILHGALMSWELKALVGEIQCYNPFPEQRRVLTKAALTTQGDRDGLADLGQALREAARALNLSAFGRVPGWSADKAFASFKATMLGLDTVAPEFL